MGLGNVAPETEEQNQNNDGDEKVAYIYVRSEDNMDAYNLMSTGKGGSAAVRNWIKNDLPDSIAKDQHDFFQKIVVCLGPVRESDDFTELFEFLHVDAQNIAQYLDQNSKVRAEVIRRLKQSQEVRKANEPDEEESEPVEADD